MPRDVVALCIGKSTIARAGWNCLCTPIEPGWDGYITLEFQNTTDRPNTFYANEGCLQLVFLQLGTECDVSYADRGGKYNGQAKRIVLPRV
uniref:dCTP deaminase family protein n=1 Tax=Pseudomonas phage RVTF4 TaxID=3236931 RepID=A0AB39CDA7_9VIRU